MIDTIVIMIHIALYFVDQYRLETRLIDLETVIHFSRVAKYGLYFAILLKIFEMIYVIFALKLVFVLEKKKFHKKYNFMIKNYEMQKEELIEGDKAIQIEEAKAL